MSFVYFEELEQDHLHDECGVFGMYHRGDMEPQAAYYALQALQHRGQESAGLAGSDGKKIICHKGQGLASKVFDEKALKPFSSQKIVIGHVRYSTAGNKGVINAQPMVGRSINGQIAIAHNGQLVNAARLGKDLQSHGSVFMSNSDSELFLHLFARYQDQGDEFAVRKILQFALGSYALVIMTEKKLIAVRDPYGIRPLVLGKLGNTYMVASESCALSALGAELVRDVRPGEMLVLDENGIHSVQLEQKQQGSCIFEYVYFARSDSIIDSVSVVEARKRAGAELAKLFPVEADLVAGVPDSALPSAMGYAEQSGIPYGEVLVKNRYINRTFIQPTQSMREMSVRIKLSALSSAVQGKRIVLVDDSIVRGTTIRKLVDMLKAAGATEVHLRISSPPVCHPCYLGIDTPSERQLINATKSVEEIRQQTGATTLAYLTVDALERATNPNMGFCLGCFTGKYPMDIKACRRCGFHSND